MSKKQRSRAISLLLALLLVLLLLPDHSNRAITETFLLATELPETSPEPSEPTPEPMPEEMLVHLGDMEDDGDEDPEDAPTSAPQARFEAGYVRVRADVLLYADPLLTEPDGWFAGTGCLWAESYARGSFPEEDVLAARFVVPGETSSRKGYLRFDTVKTLSEAEQEELEDALAAGDAPLMGDVLLPEIAYTPVDVPEEPETEIPTEAPEEEEPTEEPTEAPTEAPEEEEPTPEPTEEPTAEPTEAPTEAPTIEPAEEPTVEPTEAPEEEEPTPEPTEEPTAEPTEAPTEAPTIEPAEEPTVEPTEAPEIEPTEEPTPAPEPRPEVPRLRLRGRTLAEHVNLRAEPTVDSPALTTVSPLGTEMEVLGFVKVGDYNWFHVICGEYEGYIRGDLLEVWEDILPEQEEDEEGEEAADEAGGAQEVEELRPPFEQSRTVNGVVVTVTAAEGIFPEGATLSVKRVSLRTRREVEAAVEQERDEDMDVAVSYTFDIEVRDAEGNAIEFVPDADVKVAFTTEEVADENLVTQVYHVEEDEDGNLSAQKLEVVTEEETAVVTTEGFSYYLIEFSYNGNMVYRMEPGKSVLLSHILQAVGLEGEVIGVQFTNGRATASREGADWRITPQDTLTYNRSETMRVTINTNGVSRTYSITLKCVAMPLPSAYPDCGELPNQVVQRYNHATFLRQDDATAVGDEETGSPRATIYVDPTMMQKQFAENQEPWFFNNDFKYDGETVYYQGEMPIDREKGAEKYFEGKCFEIRFKNAAFVKETGVYKDLVLTFSNIRFVTPANMTVVGTNYSKANKNYPQSAKTYVAYLVDRTTGDKGVGIRSGNSGTELHVGLEVDVNIKVDGAGEDDTFYFTMYDIDVTRSYNSNHGALYGAGDHYSYSEQVQINSGSRSKAYIPQEDYMCSVTTTKQNSTTADGLLFLSNPDVNSNDNNTFRSGFAVLADAKNGISFTLRSGAGSNNQSVNTSLMPEGVGEMYVKKRMDPVNSTKADRTRKWIMEDTVNGIRFENTVPVQGVDDPPTFVGNFITNKRFTVAEKAEDGAQVMANYDTPYYTVTRRMGSTDSKDEGYGLQTAGDIWCYNLIEFTNKRLTETLTVRKRVDDPKYLDPTVEWNFELKAYDLMDDGKPEPITGLTVEGVSNWAETPGNSGIYTFTLKHGDSLEIVMPKGCHYELSETMTDDRRREYYVEPDGGVYRDTLDNATTRLFENIRRQELDLTLEKKVSGNIANTAKYFKYTIQLTLPYEPSALPETGGSGSTQNEGQVKEFNISGTFSPASEVNARERREDVVQVTTENLDKEGKPTKIVMSGGSNATFPVWLRHGENITIGGLPSGTAYTITEHNDMDYRVTTHVTGDTLNGDPYSTHPIALANNTSEEEVTVSDSHLHKNTDIEYINRKETTIPTGIIDDMRPALWCAVVALALLLVADSWDKRRRRTARRS